MAMYWNFLLQRVPVLLIGVLMADWVFAIPKSEEKSSGASPVSQYASSYKTFTRLTGERIDMEKAVAMLCKRTAEMSSPPHAKSVIHLYANEVALEARRRSPEAAGAWPVGSVLVKEKFESASASDPVLLTVMEKTASAGKVDDWQFYTVSLPGGATERSTSGSSCTECHVRYGKTGYVSSLTDGLLTAAAKRKPQ